MRPSTIWYTLKQGIKNTKKDLNNTKQVTRLI